MKAPAQSFKSELAAYRQDLAALAPPLSDHVRKFALKTVDVWMSHHSVETIWTTLQPKLPPEYSAREFILDVLASGFRAKKLETIVFDVDNVKAKTLARNKRLLKDERYRQAADELNLLADVRERRKQLLSREKKTAAHTYFMKGWREKLTKLCGQPFDGIIAELAFIALGSDVTPEAVRGTQRDTTRSGRRRP